MSASTVLTLGLGTFSSPQQFLLLGFDSEAAVPLELPGGYTFRVAPAPAPRFVELVLRPLLEPEEFFPLVARLPGEMEIEVVAVRAEPVWLEARGLVERDAMPRLRCRVQSPPRRQLLAIVAAIARMKRR